MRAATASGAIPPPAATAAAPFGRIDLSELRQHVVSERELVGPSFDDVLADRVPASQGWGDEPFFWAEIQVQDERWVDGTISDPPQSPRHWALLVTAGVLSVAVLVGVAVLLIMGVERATSWLPALLGT